MLRTDLLSGYIELYLIARTHLQVASGASDARGDREIAALETHVGRYTSDNGQVKQEPVIPGSSLKGMVAQLGGNSFAFLLDDRDQTLGAPDSCWMGRL